MWSTNQFFGALISTLQQNNTLSRHPLCQSSCIAFLLLPQLLLLSLQQSYLHRDKSRKRCQRNKFDHKQHGMVCGNRIEKSSALPASHLHSLVHLACQIIRNEKKAKIYSNCRAAIGITPPAFGGSRWWRRRRRVQGASWIRCFAAGLP